MPFIGVGTIEGGEALRMWLGGTKNPVLDVLSSRCPSVIEREIMSGL